MKLLALFLFFAIAGTAHAQSILVKSGEHEGFTRLVVSFPRSEAWSLVREPDGYRITTGSSEPNYDLDDVFRRISRDRLDQIFPDASTGALRLILNCECFAAPFELQNGMLVIDIKDGTAAPNSEFERAADGRPLPPLGSQVAETALDLPQKTPTTQTTLGADTLSLPSAIANAARHSSEKPLIGDPSPTPSRDALRETLLWQLSKGVAEGVVDVSTPIKKTQDRNKHNASESNIRVEKESGMSTRTTAYAPDQMTSAGGACLSDAKLDIANWGTVKDVPADFSTKTTGLVSEFDHPDTEAISNAVRYYLALGFGAEARQLLHAFKVSPDDRAVWESMSHIVDLEIPTGHVFSEMYVCDTSASLWAVLAKAEMPPANSVATHAILRAFSALPIDLRRHLGPGLADRFLSRNDIATARSIRDSILRAGGDAGPKVQLLEATIDLANGQSSTAEDLLAPLAGRTGDAGIQATITLIETQVNKGKEVPADLTVTAEALLQQATGGENEPALQHALALAYASQSRFDEAFKLADSSRPSAVPIWRILANSGSNDAIISNAILQNSKQLPKLPSETKNIIARRLLDLGFPDSALIWLAPSPEIDGQPDPSDQLLTAKAEAARKNYISALSVLEGLDTDPAQALRAQILANLQTADAVQQLDQSGQPQRAAFTARQQRNWAEVVNLDDGNIWKNAAELTLTLPKPDETQQSDGPVKNASTDASGPLAKSREVLSESAAARTIIDELLAAQQVPPLFN